VPEAAPLADLGPLVVRAVEVHRVDLPFVRPVRTALGVAAGRRPVLVRVLGADGEVGWGECSAEDAPGYWHEYADACEAVLHGLVAPGLGSVAVGSIPRVPGWPMASAALEMAVLDALCRRAGVSLSSWLGGRRSRVEATLTVGIGESVDTDGYRNVKLKVDGAAGPDLTGFADVTVSADANGSLSADGFGALADLGLDHVEQPLAADDLVGHAALRRIVPGLPVALDESIRSAGDVRTVAALGAADIVVLKPGRVGGLLAARRAHDDAVAAGLRCKVGGMWDTGIGRAAALAVASLPGCSVAPDLAAADRYWARDVVADPAALDTDGCLTVPSGPGLGVEVVLPPASSGTQPGARASR
jgi:o-succinylbenzoate synthase